MKTKNIFLILAALIVVAVVFVSAKSIFTGTTVKDTNTNTYPTSTNDNGEYQTVKLVLDNNYNYELQPSTLKKGVPVRMEVDLKTVVGCARSITIPEFGVRKYVTANDNIVTFTPTKSGTFKIACSMNMYVGTFTVTDDGTGTTQTLAEQTPVITTTKSASTGGCGCGGTTGSCGMRI